MSFVDNVGNGFNKVARGLANDISLPSLINDIASVASNDKNFFQDALSIAGGAFKTSIAAASLPVRKIGGFAIDEILLPAAQWSYETGGKYARQPISAGLLTLATGNAKKAWEQKDEISAGQALTYLGSKFIPGGAINREDFDIFDANDRKIFEQDWGYRSISGAFDTFFSTVTDPLGKVGKAAGLARKAMITRPLGAEDAGYTKLLQEFVMPKSIRKTTIISPSTLAATINAGREEAGETFTTLSWFAKSDKIAIREHPMVKASNDGDTLAYLLGEAKTVDDTADVLLATALRDTEAMARLVDKRKDLAFVFDNLKDASKVDTEILDNIPTNGIVDDVNKLDAAEEVLRQAENDRYYNALIGLNAKGADLTKRTFGMQPFEKMAINRAERRAQRNLTGTFDAPTSFPTVGYYQPTKFHPLVAVVNFGIRKVGDAFTESPSGYLFTNDADSYGEVTAFGNALRRIIGEEANPIIQRQLDNFITAPSPELKGTVATDFEEVAVAAIHRSLGITDEAGAAIWGAYKRRRESAMEQLSNRKFLMTNDNVVLKIPYLERQGANAIPMLDLQQYHRVLSENIGLTRSLDNAMRVADPDETRYIAGILNDMWKASVLLRLGYTIRNVSEGALSVLGKGYGLVAAAQLFEKDAARAWWNNRKTGYDRIIDKRLVNTGKREDSVQIRERISEIYDEMAMSNELDREHLVAVIDAADRAFRRGTLDEGAYAEFLDVFGQTTGEWMYHGSVGGIKQLDNNRPLAMNLNEARASQWAESGIPVISVAELYRRQFGRAVKLPKEITQRPGAPIGTTAVSEQMTTREFNAVDTYVQGDVNVRFDAQNFLRGNATARGGNAQFINNLKRAIERSVIKQNTVVFRKTSNPDFVKAKVGDIIEEKGFTSTSKVERQAEKFTSNTAENVMVEIRLPKGVSGLDVNAAYRDFTGLPVPGYVKSGTKFDENIFVAEQEVLLPPGLKFKVVDIQQDNKFIVEAVLPTRKPAVTFSAQMQEFGDTLRQGLVNTIAKGNQVEILNPSTGTWRAIDPETVSEDLLITSQFRIRKPGNQGQLLGAKVYGQSLDLRTMRGGRAYFGLRDYPEVMKILGITGREANWGSSSLWEGKERQLLAWMRANGVSKLTLPDTKARGGHTVLVDPEMIESFGQQPSKILAERRLDAVKKSQQLLSDSSRMVQMLYRTIEQGGGTFKLAMEQSGDVPKQGISVAVRGATHAFSVADAQANPQLWINSLADHIEANLGKMATADHFGTWVEDIDGVPHIWSEPVNVVLDRPTAVKLGIERNQKGVFDVGKGEFISTGGTGDEKASAAFGLGKGTQAIRGDVARGAQGVRGEVSAASIERTINDLTESISNGKYPVEGLLNFVRQKADTDAAIKRDLQELLGRLNGRVQEETRLYGPRQVSGTGKRTTKLFTGQVMEYDDAFAGELGQILSSRTDNAQTYRNFVDAPSQLFQANFGNMVEDVLSPDMPQYYSGYANSLTTFFRSPTDDKIDPIIEQFLNGRTPEQVINWLRKPENSAYRARFNIDVPGIKAETERLNVAIDAEDFVGDLYSAYQRYLPDAEIQEAFRNNEITEMWLREHFADNPNMPEIVGRFVPTSPQATNFMEKTQKFVEKAFYFLGSLPETTLARHPLARAVYRSEMENRANIALAIKRNKFGDDAELTIADINGFRRDAIEATRREVNKTLFTIIRKSYAGEKMRFIMPFFNAWENTIRRWSTLSMENPAIPARAGQIVSSLRNQPNVVDKDGNPTEEFNYDNKIILPMSETLVKMLPSGLETAMRAAGMQVSIPVRSLDILFQGEAIAGFGPIVAMPASEIVKLRPDLMDVLKPVLPMGPSDSLIKQVIPPAIQKLYSVAAQDEAWSRTFNTVYRYELIKYKLGERTTEPTLEEVQTLSNNMYFVKMLSNLVMPFAAQYDSPLSWYTQQFRKLQDTYGKDAETIFLQMYPDLAEATVSTSLNTSGAQASVKAWENSNKYKGLISKIGNQTPEMIGFLVNDANGQYDFSEAVYAWQYGNSPVPGSNENYRERRNPALLKQDANKKIGWVQFRKNMDLLESQLFAQGFTSFNQRGAEELQILKQAMVSDLAAKNKDWYADFLNVDRGKWIYRIQSMQTMLNDPKWMQDNANRPVVRSIAIYLNTRQQIARELTTRKAQGMPSTLAAEANQDLDGVWNTVLAQLKQESLEFSDFYNRFLQNDPVTLG